MKIGFTGTQLGMTSRQKDVLRGFLLGVSKDCEAEFHHGDCIGADAQAHDIALDVSLLPVLHPPVDDSRRAFKNSLFGVLRVYPALQYIDRNRMIVSETDFLVAAPKGFAEEQRSGTWSTIRYAKKTNKKVYIIYPDGECDFTKGEPDAV